MKIQSLIKVVFIILISLEVKSQVDTTKSIYLKLDTMKFYNVSLSSGPLVNCVVGKLGGPTKYFVDCKEVSKAEYDKYDTIWKKIESCKPCYLQTYDKNDILLYEGLEYNECRVGIWKEFYPSGKIKILGHYKENPKTSWTNIYPEFCGSKHGLWVYYNEKGEIIKSEKYENNKRIK